MKKSILFVSILGAIFIFSCKNVSNKNSGEKNHEHGHVADVYACTMHPEITGVKGDKCSKCGMELEPVMGKGANDIEVKITPSPSEVQAGKVNELSLSLTRGGKNVSLDISHEKKIHLVIVDETLTWLDHIHPEEQPNGSYTVKETFPYSGKYILYTDFKVNNESGTVNKQELEVAGSNSIKADTTTRSFVSKIDGYTVTLANGDDFKTNMSQYFGISISKNGKQITASEIQPYLGAVAHVILINKADKDFLHVHPTSNEKYPINGETHFEKSGLYKMWVEFQIEGKVHRANFTVNVSENSGSVESKSHGHDGHKH